MRQNRMSPISTVLTFAHARTDAREPGSVRCQPAVGVRMGRGVEGELERGMKRKLFPAG